MQVDSSLCLLYSQDPTLLGCASTNPYIPTGTNRKKSRAGSSRFLACLARRAMEEPPRDLPLRFSRCKAAASRSTLNFTISVIPLLSQPCGLLLLCLVIEWIASVLWLHSFTNRRISSFALLAHRRRRRSTVNNNNTSKNRPSALSFSFNALFQECACCNDTAIAITASIHQSWYLLGRQDPVYSRWGNKYGCNNATPYAMSADESADASTIPPTNGELHPSDPLVMATPGKRKRGSGSDETSAHEAGSSVTESQDRESLQENLRNLVEILSKCAHPD